MAEYIMKKIFIIIAIVTLMTFTGCEHVTVSGTVIEKTHNPSHIYMYPIKCGNVTTIQQVIIPEEWVITVEDNDGIKHSIEVTEEEYKMVRTGEKYETTNKREGY